jgi:hypothetical protein
MPDLHTLVDWPLVGAWALLITLVVFGLAAAASVLWIFAKLSIGMVAFVALTIVTFLDAYARHWSHTHHMSSENHFPQE